MTDHDPCVCPVCREAKTRNNPDRMVEELRERFVTQRDLFISTLASLCAAVSLLENGGKKAAASDKMFFQMLKDFNKTIETARQSLRGDAK